MAAATGRVLRRLGVGAVLLLVLLHLAGGWYFAGMIGRDALAVRPWPAAQDLTVVKVSGDRITLRDPAPPNPAARSGATFGLEWDGGYGVVSGKPKVSGDEVVRRWRPVAGRATARQRVTIDNTARPRTQLAEGERQVRFSPRLTGRFYEGAGPTWAILVHGKGAGPQEMERMAAPMRDLGLPTLLIHYRNDPGAPRDPSGRHQFGATEWQDLAAAVGWARGEGAERFVLGGASMGGAIVASYLRNTPRAPVVTAVLDAPMLSLRRTIEHGAAQRSIPGTQVPIPNTLVWVAEQIAAVRYDLDWDQVDYVTDPDWARIPVYVVHGARDTTVPISTSRQLAALDDQVTLYEEAEAEHVQAWNFDPGGYRTRVRIFVRDALK